MAAVQIRSLMHPFPHSVGTDQTLQTAKKLLEEHRIRHLPVRAAGELVGILTDRDIHFALAVDKADAAELTVEECYTREPYVVNPDTPAATVTRRMAQDHLGCALVVEEGKLVGIFTTTDACRVLAEILSERVEQ